MLIDDLNFSESKLFGHLKNIFSQNEMKEMFGRIDIITKEFSPSSLYDKTSKLKDLGRFNLDCSIVKSSKVRIENGDFTNELGKHAAGLLCGLSLGKHDLVDTSLAVMASYIGNGTPESLEVAKLSYILKNFISDISKISISGRERLNILKSIKWSFQQQLSDIVPSSKNTGVMFLYCNTLLMIDNLCGVDSLDLHNKIENVRLKVFENMIINGNVMRKTDFVCLRERSETLNVGISLASPSL
jgi:hypothetical protein